MGNTGKEIVELLDVEKLDDDRFRGAQPQSTTLAKVFGGQLFGQALAAAQRTVPSDRPAHSMQAFFLDAARYDQPLEFRVGRLHDGRSFSARSVLATQGKREVMRGLASFQVPEAGLAHAPMMPKVPHPDALPPIQEAIRIFSDMPHEPWWDEWSGLDVRYVVTERTGRPDSGPSLQQVWCRVRDRLPDAPILHRQILAYLSDLSLLSSSLTNHGMVLGAQELPRATLNHTAWLHADVRADEWMLFDQRSPWAGNARGLALAEVFQEGRHVASFAQEGLIRPYGDLRSRLGIA